MEVLVAVEMGEPQSGLLKARDLGRDFALDFIPAYLPEQRAFEEFALCAGKTSCFINKGRQRLGRQHGLLFHQRQMHANIQCRQISRQRDGIFERAPGHQERGTRHDSVLKRTHNPAVDAGRQSQIVGVYNKPLQNAETWNARISRRIFIRKATSSRIILIITSGLARVEVPRFLGK